MADPSRVLNEIDTSRPKLPEITIATRLALLSTPSTTLYTTGWKPITSSVCVWGGGESHMTSKWFELIGDYSYNN